VSQLQLTHDPILNTLYIILFIVAILESILFLSFFFTLITTKEKHKDE
jgi:hypothetical protein